MKKSIVASISIILVLLMCSCSNMNKTPDEGKMLEDYKAVATHLSYTNLDKAEFVRQQYKKDEMKFVADAKFTGKDDYADYTCLATLTYNYYDDQGWMLDEYTDNGLTTACHTGRTFEEAEKQLEKNPIQYIPNSTYIDVTGLKTYLNNNMEKVTVNYQVYNKHLAMTYEDAELTFTYSQGQWILTGIDKEVDNIFVNLENTEWITDDFSGIDITITDISADSRNVTFVCRGEEYKGEMTNTYSEETFTKHGPVYKLNKELFLGNVWGVNQFADNFTIYDLTGNDDVWMFFNDLKSLNGGYGAGYQLVGDAPEW